MKVLIPNIIAVLGQIEDLALHARALNAFLKAVPRDIRAKHGAPLGFD